MDKTKASNGFLWSCLVFSMFMAAHLYIFIFFVRQRDLPYRQELYTLVAMLSLIILASIFVVFSTRVLKDGRKITNFLGFKSPGFSNMALGAIAVLLFVPGTAVLNMINVFIVEFISGVKAPVPDISSTVDMGLFQALFLMAFLPAVCEELLYRGFILGATSGYSKKAAIIFNGFLFALAHISLVRILDTFVLGMILAYVTLKTKSVFPAMFMHFVNNASRIVLAFLLTNFLESYQQQAEMSIDVGMIQILTYILFFTFGILIFLGGLFLISKMKSVKDYKRWLFGLDPEPEMPKRKDAVPFPVQLLFIIPGLICYIVFSVYFTYNLPFPDFIQSLFS